MSAGALPLTLCACLLLGAPAHGLAARPRVRAMLPVRSVAVLRARTLASAELGEPDADLAQRKQLQPPPTELPALDLARIGVLLTVPIAWGTYAPAVKIAYAAASEPSIPGILLSGGQYLVAVLTLSAASAIVGTQPAAPPKSEHDRPAFVPSGRGTWLAGLELGSYLFVANLLQISGLQQVPTDRAAFLVQTTTLLVPLIDAAQRGGLGRLPARTWAACLLAFAGVVTMSGASFSGALAQLGGGAGALPPTGDLLILGSAFFYSWHVIRLSALAPGLDPLQVTLLTTTTILVDSTYNCRDTAHS
jgi:drug/metabolite transporter (DMT)-like permease